MKEIAVHNLDLLKSGDILMCHTYRENTDKIDIHLILSSEVKDIVFKSLQIKSDSYINAPQIIHPNYVSWMENGWKIYRLNEEDEEDNEKEK